MKKSNPDFENERISCKYCGVLIGLNFILEHSIRLHEVELNAEQ